jgi:hypothetical protein
MISPVVTADFERIKKYPIPKGSMTGTIRIDSGKKEASKAPIKIPTNVIASAPAIPDIIMMRDPTKEILARQKEKYSTLMNFS